MEIAIHLGAHCTDEDLIVQTLHRDEFLRREAGFTIPAPRRFRPALRHALQEDGDDLLPGASNSLVAELLEGVEGRRLILSYEGFLAARRTAFSQATIYPEAAVRCARLRDLFPGHEVSFLMGIRNPATLIPAVFEASSEEDFVTFIAGLDLSALAWSDTVGAIRETCPDVPLTLWCNEDLPLIWPELLRATAGLPLRGPERLEGEFAILERIMTPEGLTQLRDHLRVNPPKRPIARRRIVSDFLAEHADSAEIAPEIDQPGWGAEVIAGLSENYEADVARLTTRGDISFLAP
ncbi:hypothetical protein JSE7799_02419 [Jannaschia seosinensis]|uniref:Uncharacterized protein n=1 Tax=Jannaschia seosinensis TaxID=313367 RepID=A0A0M7BBC0_9RHOB|nr:hypothetical protein [Jannaschia seosinensis]CUH39691.1 hypothetical protein JSE7799_02419 [Jannaschia seosinensis]